MSGATGDPLGGNLDQGHGHLKFLLPPGAGGQGGGTPNFGGGNAPNPGAGLLGAPDLTSIDQLVQLLKFGSGGPGTGGGHQTPNPNLFGGVLGQLENGGNSQNLAQVPNPPTHKHH